MNKFDMSAQKKPNSFSRKLILILLCSLGIFGSLRAQNVEVTSSLGAPGTINYLTLKVAFDAINAGTHQGVITISIKSNTLETATAILNSSVLPSSYTSVTITPNAAGRVITGNLPTAVVKLSGSDNVTIDGLVGGVRGLTFSNTNTNNTSGVVWIASASSSDGASNNAVKNCIVTGSGAVNTLVGITQSSGTTLGGLAETANSNNSYVNNLVSAAQFGIGVVGATGNQDNNTQILTNTINTLGRVGVFVSTQKNVVVSKNIISGINSNLGSFTVQNSGIMVVGSITGGLIEKNDISNVQIASFWGCSGIQLDASNTNTGMVISNNFIYNIAAGGFPFFDSVDDNGTGIAVDAGGGYLIEYNSIDLSTNQPQAGITAAIWFSSGMGAATVTLKNNIFSNRETTSTRYAIYTNTTTSSLFASINYNDYYSPTGAVGFLSSARTSLANWQAVSGGDVNSVSVNPFYTSVTNLHLLGNSPLDALGTPVAGITTDIDGDIRNATTPDIGADEFTPPNCSGSLGGTATASVTSICGSGSSVLTSTGYSFGVGITYQWQSSSTGVAGTFSNLAGQINPLSGNTGTISVTTYYQLLVTCSFTATSGTSNVIQVTVNNPAVTGASAATRCGVGTTTAVATGTNLQWYTAATGGLPIGTGSPFTTPSISATTTFYVTSSSAGVNCTAGKSGTTGPDGGYNGTDAGLVFDANQAFKITSVKMYPQAAGTVTISALTSAGSLIASINYTFTGASSTGVVVPLGFNIPIGTSHRLVVSGNTSSIAIWRDFTGNTFPYTICTVGSITNGWLSGTIATYYFFYDWQVTTSCESTRTPVTATVTPPPALTSLLPAPGPARTICQGGCVTLSASGGGYTTYTWNPGNLPSPAVVCPTATTTYTLTSDIPGGCRREDFVTITVNATPTPLTVTPSSASVCPSPTTTAITATGGLIPGQSIYTETGEGTPPFSFTLTNIGTGTLSVGQNTTYFQQGSKSIWLTHNDNANGAIQTTANIPLTGFTNPSLTFYHIAGLEAFPTNHYDVGYVEYALTASPVETDWVKFPASTVSPGATLIGGVAGFDNTSYPDWDAQFSGSGSTPGIAPATSLWKQETINLTTWQGAANFRIRFHLVADFSIIYYGWLIDNIKITGTGQAPITWSPVTNLYFQLPATPANVYVAGTDHPNVWFVAPGPVAATTYTATATGGVSCNSTATTTLSASSLSASVTITQNPAGTICGGTCVTFTATPTNGGAPPAFQWFVNNISQGPSTVGATTFTTCTLGNNNQVKCQMSVNPNVGACITASVVTSNILTILVNPKPTANPITGSTGTTVCTGAPNLLTENATGIISTYEWHNAGGIVGTNSNTYSALLPGTYFVIVTTNLGCKDTSANFIITQPTYTITATAGANGTISPSGTVVVNCGDNQTFTITANPGYSILDVVVDGLTNPGAIASGTYTFTNVMANGHTINATFFVVGCPTPATSNAGSNASICAGSNYTISGASIGGPASSGTWTSSNGNSGTFNPSAVFGTATSYTPSALDISNGSVDLTLTTNDPAGPCPASASTVSIIIKPSPIVTITGQIGLCSAGATQTWLVADTSATVVNVTGFQWYHPFPGTPVGTNNDSLQTAVGATGSYTIVVSGANGCTGSNTVAVNLLPTPTISISGLGPICTDAGVDINATAATSSGTILPNGYAWYQGAVLIPSVTVSILTATSPGSYTATATNSFGCRSALSSPPVVLAADNSPLNGLYTIGVGVASCTNYVSFARAINDLNTRGISGNCVFSVPAGYTETVPFAGLKLGSATLNPQTATGKTINFSKSGSGANPLLTAYTNGVNTFNSAKPDGIFCLRGVNNVAISQIDLTENAANSTANTFMEYGYGMFKYSPSDGAQNNSIQNCVITLNKTNGPAASPIVDGSNGIVIVNAVDTAATTFYTPTSAAGTNSNNKMYGNTITNVHNGITLIGFSAPSPFTLADFNNDIGGTSAATGNTITNFGNSGDAGAPSGIRIVDQWGVNASFNTIDNNNGSGSNTTNVLRGISAAGGTSGNGTFSTNLVTLKSNSTGSSVVGIDNGMGSTPAGNTISIFNNTITGSSLLSTGATWTGIANTATAATVSITNNKIQNITLTGTAAFNGINNSAVASNLLVGNNLISGNTKSSTGIMSLITSGSPTNATINDNNLINNVITGGGAACTLTGILGGTSVYTLDHNVVYNNSITGMSGAAVGTISGYNNQSAPTQETITGNSFSKLFITGNSTGLQVIRGINNATIAGQLFRVVMRNTIDTLYSTAAMSAAITGIASAAGANVSISKNVITSLWPGQSVTAGSFARGISITTAGSSTVKAFNNSIAIDLTQGPNNGLLTNPTGVSGIDVSGAGTTDNIYFNTIRLAGSGAAGFGSSGIAQSNGVLDVRNNIVANYMTPGSGGFATALRRTGGTYSNSSNNNLWYTVQDATHPIYYTGAAVITFAAFQAAVTPRETFSIPDNPVFVSTANNDLHLDPAGNCNLDGAGAPIATYLDDLDGDVRDVVLPDVGMDEFTGTGTGFVWKGKNTDWFNANNWCGGIPTATSDVVIPTGKPFYPIILLGTTALARNININSGGNILINDGGALANTGSWTNNGTLTNNGNIILNGTTTQTFPGTVTTGLLPAMDSLTVNNAGGAIINKVITLTGSLKPKLGNIAVNDSIILHSDLSGTARVDTIQGSISYGALGKFVVERYISSKVGAVARTAWRFLSAPIGGTQTINAAWQNGEIAPAYTANGYGMQIVGPGTAAMGFDMNNTLSSLKKYDGPTNTWVTVPGTLGPISAPDGYIAFIRGDRGSNIFGSSSATTLRVTGPIKSGPITVSTANANVNQFVSVGNPYPSAISFATASTVKTGLNDVYYVWDPKLSSYGAFQSFSGPTYAPVPGGGSYTAGNNAIESGEAFFVVSNSSVATHSIQMTENSKLGSNVQVARLNSFAKQINTRLYLVTDSTHDLYDGNRVDFDPAYVNMLDDNDMPKMSNFGESIGLLREGKSISVERRAEVVNSDTIFFNLGNMRQKQYQLEFTAENLASPVLTGYLEDGYLNTRTEINLDGVTSVDFIVNADAASKASDRFRIVFRQQGPVALSFTSIRAYRQDKNIMVNWKIENEINIAQYEVERSADGHSFSKIGTQLARNIAGASSQHYNLLDIAPLAGDNFYRIKSVGNNADIKYSEIVKVNMKGDPSIITAYPNPVKEDGILKISFTNEPVGVYNLSLINVGGQVITTRSLNYEGGNSVYVLTIDKSVAHGHYVLQISEGNKLKTTLKIVY